MANNRSSDLYRWKRWSTKDTSSTSAHMNTRKVEKASDRAAAVTFGLGNSRRGDGYSLANSYGTAAATLEAVHDHDEAHSEAQDLLSQWMAQKCGLDDDEEEDDLRYFEDDVDVRDYAASKKAAKTDLKDQWNNLLAENDPVAADPYHKMSSEELFRQIETRDDDQSVQSILDELMKKDIVESSFKKDLGIGAEATKKRHDPRTTMAARQQKVKENREKRQQSREAQLRQQQQHKEAQSQARQMVMKEERSKAMQRQREEALMQQEMARLRKDMQEQRRLAEEARQREKEIEARKHEELRQEEARRRQEELHTRLNAESLIQEERRKMEQKLENARAMKAGQDLKSLQRHFHAWYELVLSKRLALGKARAVADWRTLLRAWNAWRAYVRASWAERETREIEENFKDLHRKKQIAADHYHRTILRKYLSVWCLWLRQEQQSRELEQQQHQTKSKMAAFLEAAASGKLWTNRSEEEGDGDAKAGKKGASDRPDSVAQKLDDLFGEPARPVNPKASVPSTARSDVSTTSEVSQTKRQPNHSAGPGKPKYAWQVMRKHVDLPVEEILAAGEDDDNAEHQPNRNQNNAVDNANPKTSASGATSKRSISYKPNSFEHRYAAQQRVLQEQQQQLREQKRLIEDLQTAQRQQLLRAQLGGGAEATSDVTRDPNELPEGLPDSGRSQPGAGTAPSTGRSDLSDSSTTSAGSKNKEPTRPPLLKGMKDREAARLKMKADREERQLKREQEKLAEIKAKEERQRQEEEDEKKAKMEKRRGEKRLAKQRELEKQQRLEHLQQQTCRADEHYRQTLLRRKGLDPWMRLVHMARQNMQVAEDHHSSVLLKKCLLPWRQYADEVLQEKLAMAEKQYEVILLRRSFQSLKRYGHLQSIQLQKARRHYAFTLKGKVFQAWQKHVTDEKLRMWKNEEAAEEHNEIRIMKTSFLAWKRYPQMLKAERARDKRLENMRKKVASILPDFGDS
ncbi:coiled-coil domain-containing protein 191-like isoform X2 [Patiria miniata]|uniref:Uncharacterized protein n=1 Tax=Patiria miniata TaxID=46514 RepID=A0A914ANG4_PATMI|nr:coiled-coil domain-containing protein 191-like isoform X2 [Patiria miniata]